ncbi:Uncharacterised protein [Chlamydia abortus]|nr:Uncharacterised protein [Chlamydia abortus]
MNEILTFSLCPFQGCGRFANPRNTVGQPNPILPLANTAEAKKSKGIFRLLSNRLRYSITNARRMDANGYVMYEIIHGLRTDMRMPRIIVQLKDMLRELFFSTACIITLKRRELSQSLVLFYYTTKVIQPTKERRPSKRIRPHTSRVGV